MLAVAALLGMVGSAFAANIPNPELTTEGQIWRHETTSGVNQLLEPVNGVYGLHTFAADANDWDSQFYFVFANAVVRSGTPIHVSFQYRKTLESGDVRFNAQGHANPGSYVNNDGWSTLEATEEWQTYTGSIDVSGEIRCFAVNASIGRDNGTLLMRNIVIDVDGDEVLVTKETDANDSEIGEAPIIEVPEPTTKMDFTRYFASVDTITAHVEQSYFVATNYFVTTNQRVIYIPKTVKFGDDNVFAFAVDSTCPAPWNVQFFAYWTREIVDSSTISPSEVILSFDYWYDWEAATSGNISHDDLITGAGNQGAKWGALSLANDADGKAIIFKDGKVAWVHYEDTIKDKKWFFELHLGANKPNFSYTAFLKNVEVKVNGLVVASMNNFSSAPNIDIEVFPKEIEIEGLIYKINETHSARITGYDHYANIRDITIPTSISFNGKDIPVTGIDIEAFRGCTSLKSINIPNSITYIGSYAFGGCNNLTSVTINNSITYISTGTFDGCSSLTSIEIPNSVTLIGDNAFRGCSSLTSIDIPNSVYSIGRYAFGNCSRLTSINIPNSVTSIGSSAFYSCSGLTSVTIPNSITSIGESVFSNCSSLTEVIIPSSVTHIGLYAFSYCSNLTSINIPNSVTRIDKHAFASCTSLTSITIPNSVTNIGEYAFDGCGNVISVTIGESVSNIGQCAFNGCNSIKNIICKGLVPPKVVNELLTDNIISDAKLYMNATLTRPENAKLYKTLQPWCNFDAPDSNTVHTGETIYVIGNNSVRYNIKMTSADTKMGIAIGTGKYDKDETAEIVAIAYYGYHFTKWSDGNTENPRFVNVISDSTFTAEFEVNNYSVLAAANEKEMGKVEGAATYAYLSRTQLKATPNAGYQFEKWSDGETANPRDILVYSDTTFTAIFEIAGCEPVVTSVSESAVSATNIYAYGNTIVVENATDEIRVYNAMGVLVCRDAARHVSTGITSIPVNAPGVYIVKTGSTVKRVMIN